MALTATANEQVINDVIGKLGIQGCVLLAQSFNRPNLFYDVRPKRTASIVEDINAWIRSRHMGETGIIYCLSRNKCEEVAQELRDKYKYKARHYHAAMTPEDKARAQEAWQKGECHVMVATVCIV
jgi:bloom syndrome protein